MTRPAEPAVWVWVSAEVGVKLLHILDEGPTIASRTQLEQTRLAEVLCGFTEMFLAHIYSDDWVANGQNNLPGGKVLKTTVVTGSTVSEVDSLWFVLTRSISHIQVVMRSIIDHKEFKWLMYITNMSRYLWWWNRLMNLYLSGLRWRDASCWSI